MKRERKLRSDAKLAVLSAHQHSRLRAWLEEDNLSYVAVAALVRAEFGLSVGKDAVAGYWRRCILPQRQADDVAASAAALATLPASKFDAATLKLARMLAFQALSQQQPDLPTAVALSALADRAERLTLSQRRQSLAERKASTRVQPSAAQPECPAPPADVVAHPGTPREEPTHQPIAPPPAQVVALQPASAPLYRGYSALVGPPPAEKFPLSPQPALSLPPPSASALLRPAA